MALSFKDFLIISVGVSLISFSCLISQSAQARDLVDFSLDVLSERRGGEAKQEAFDQATEKATYKLIEELLGPDKTARAWNGLKSRLLKNSSHFVVFIKGSAPEEVGGKTKITVTMRLSPDNLESFLREEGALASGTIRVLPMVVIGDSKSGTYTWWANASGELAGQVGKQNPDAPFIELLKKFTSQLSSKMKAKNIYVLDPTTPSFRMSVPAAYRTAQLGREDQILLAQYLKADVVLSGRIEGGKSRADSPDLKLNYDLTLWQAKGGRSIAELQRSEPLSGEGLKPLKTQLEASGPKVVEELTKRLAEAVTAGNLNLNQLRVVVSGAMSYRQQAEFKRQLSQLREIKLLKERRFEPGRVTFEAEAVSSGQELGKLIQRTQFPLYQVSVDGAQDDSLALSVRSMFSSSAQ